jgi:sulfur carrier protein ThiS
MGLAGVIAGIALGLTCLLHASSAWAAIVRPVYLVMLASSLLGVVYLRRERRAFYVGFATWGWLYLFCSSFNETISTRFLDWAYETMIPPERRGVPGPLRQVDLPRVYLENQLGFEDLRDAVDIKENGVVVARNAQVFGKERAGPTSVSLDLRVDAATGDRLSLLTGGRSTLTVSNHYARPFAALTESPLVERESFAIVGHSLIGMMAGLAGALAGLRFYAMREAERVSSP